MELSYSTIMTWMRYIQAGIWIINDKKDQIISEHTIIKRFTELYQNELIREASSTFAFNPMKGIGYMSVHLTNNKNQMMVVDNYGYLKSFYQGIYVAIGNKRLAFSKNLHGFSGDYFKYLDKETSDYIFVENIVNGIHIDDSPNIKRMINILFMREQPYFESYQKRDMVFHDYSDSERKMILEECHRYRSNRRDDL